MAGKRGKNAVTVSARTDRYLQEYVGYANVPVPEDIEALFKNADDKSLVDGMEKLAGLGYRVTLEPRPDGTVSCSVFGLATADGEHDGIALFAGGIDVRSGVCCLLAKYELVDGNLAAYMGQRKLAKRFS